MSFMLIHNGSVKEADEFDLVVKQLGTKSVLYTCNNGHVYSLKNALHI